MTTRKQSNSYTKWLYENQQRQTEGIWNPLTKITTRKLTIIKQKQGHTIVGKPTFMWGEEVSK